MKKIQSYRDLDVWQLAMNLVEEIYRISRNFPADEAFGLTSQIKRSVVSVPANIAEGHGRAHLNEFLRFLSIARGSLTETETHLLIAERLGFVTPVDTESTWALSQSVGRLLNGLTSALKRKQSPS